jgi:hypothetical protein
LSKSIFEAAVVLFVETLDWNEASVAGLLVNLLYLRIGSLSVELDFDAFLKSSLVLSRYWLVGCPAPSVFAWQACSRKRLLITDNNGRVTDNRRITEE